MKIIKALLSLVAAIPVLVSCSESVSQDINPETLRDSFPVIEGEQIFADTEFLSPSGLTVAGNRLLVFDHSGDMYLTALDLDGKLPPAVMGPKGFGPDDFANMRTIAFLPDSSLLFINDTGQSKARYYRFSDANPSLSADNLTGSVRFDGQLTNDIIPAGCDRMITNFCDTTGMFVMFDRDGQKISSFGSYPGDNSSIENPISFFMGHQYIMIADPKGSRLAAAGTNSDWLAFYDISTDSPELLKEYFTYESQMNVRNSTGGGANVTSARDLPETRHGYHSLAATDKYLYATYSGATMKEIEDGTAKPTCIMRYTWDGEFVDGFILADRTGARAVTPDDRYIIAIAAADGDNPDDCVIRRYPIDRR